MKGIKLKAVICIVVIIVTLNCFGQILQMTIQGQFSIVESAPGEKWLIAENNSAYSIFDEDLEQVGSFSLSSYQGSKFIYGAARDYDNDNNIEVLFLVLNPYPSVYLLDIHTNQVQMNYAGTSQYYYYCQALGYLAGERFFVISRYNISNQNYDLAYLYRSGVQTGLTDFTSINSGFDLFQNQPNPFSSGNIANSTTISFNLSRNENVSLNIYNIKGQKVASLIQNELKSAGKHSLQWNGKNDQGLVLPAGMYLYELIAGGERELKKAIIVK